jgi:hypothetical protein
MAIRLAAAVLCAATLLVAQPGAVVTGRMTIRIDGRVVTARKINGRWWSPDNRELTRTNVGWLWGISGGNARHLVRFDHHYPVDPAKVSLLDRSMGPDQVRSILGAPNSVFPSDRPEQEQMWDYYGPGGYKLSIKFSSSGQGIFTASFEPDARSMPQDVPHLAFRFNGKTASESFEESKRIRAGRPAPGAGFRTAARQPVPIPPAPPPPPSRKLTSAELQSISTGMPRARLIELLGEPYSRAGITGSEGSRETLRYQTESGATVTIILTDGKVTEAPR